MSRTRLCLALLVLALAGCSDGTAPDQPESMSLLAARSYETCALSDDGRAFCWGRPVGEFICDEDCLETPTLVPAPVAFDTIVMGGSSFEAAACALGAEGEPYCWGGLLVALDQGHSLGDLPTPLENGIPLRAIDVGDGHICGIALDGSTRCWGDYDGGKRGQDTPTPGGIGVDFVPNAVRGGLEFVAVQTSFWATCGLEAAGQVRCWGAGFLIGNTTAPLLTDDEVCGYGTPCSFDPLPIDGSYTIAAFAEQEACGISDANELICWDGSYGDPARAPVVISLPMPVVDAVAGVSHRCVLDTDGAAWCWGIDDKGQLGNGDEPASDDPVRVSGDLTFRMLTAGNDHTCGLTTGDQVYCWGANDLGQLGIGSRSDAPEPTRVEF